jgi:hypothetical protein
VHHQMFACLWRCVLPSVAVAPPLVALPFVAEPPLPAVPPALAAVPPLAPFAVPPTPPVP